MEWSSDDESKKKKKLRKESRSASTKKTTIGKKHERDREEEKVSSSRKSLRSSLDTIKKLPIADSSSGEEEEGYEGDEGEESEEGEEQESEEGEEEEVALQSGGRSRRNTTFASTLKSKGKRTGGRFTRGLQQTQDEMAGRIRPEDLRPRVDIKKDIRGTKLWAGGRPAWGGIDDEMYNEHEEQMTDPEDSGDEPRNLYKVGNRYLPRKKERTKEEIKAGKELKKLKKRKEEGEEIDSDEIEELKKNSDYIDIDHDTRWSEHIQSNIPTSRFIVEEGGHHFVVNAISQKAANKKYREKKNLKLKAKSANRGDKKNKEEFDVVAQSFGKYVKPEELEETRKEVYGEEEEEEGYEAGEEEGNEEEEGDEE